VRTRAMAMVGASIGLSFAVSLVAAPLIVGWGGLAGLFWTIALLGFVCVAVAGWVVPVVAPSPKPLKPARPIEVIAHTDLLRLNFGVFCLHLVQVALFVAIPPLLIKLGGLTAFSLWKVYLPVILGSFLLMVPAIFVTEKRRAHRQALRFAVMGMVVVLALLPWASQGFVWLALGLTGFFCDVQCVGGTPALVGLQGRTARAQRACLGFLQHIASAGTVLGRRSWRGIAQRRWAKCRVLVGLRIDHAMVGGDLGAAPFA